MFTMYRNGMTCTADEDQVAILEKLGWSKTPQTEAVKGQDDSALETERKHIEGMRRAEFDEHVKDKNIQWPDGCTTLPEQKDFYLSTLAPK